MLSKPWTLRVYDALPGSALTTGCLFAATLVLLFFLGRFLLGDAALSTQDDLRIALTQILLTAYTASAYAYLLICARRATRDLAPVAGHLPQWEEASARVTRHRGWALLLLAAASYLLIAVPITDATTPDPVNPWDWRSWNYDVSWHRVTTVFFVGWISCLTWVLIVESHRLSRLSEALDSPDLLDLEPYQPLNRQGLTNALLVLGIVSVMSLLAVESRYGPVLVGFWVGFSLLAWLGMMLPLRGIRRKIRSAKIEELAWCDRAVQSARNDLKSGLGGNGCTADILAYRSRIDSIRNWPFDNTTLIRFSLYVLIPVGSWLGGALAERGLDLFLSR